MTLQQSLGRLVVTRGEDVVVNIPLWGPVPANATFDPADETMTVLDPESGDELFTTSFETLRKMERDAYPAATTSHSVFLFSTDGESWLVDDAAHISVNWGGHMVVREGQVVVLGGDRGPQPRAPVWVGTLP